MDLVFHLTHEERMRQQAETQLRQLQEMFPEHRFRVEPTFAGPGD